jgi:hypothetical protein
MEYAQNDMLSYFTSTATFPIHNVVFQYVPSKEENKAALSFHLTQQEKKDIAGSLYSLQNQESFHRIATLFNHNKFLSKAQ